MITAMRHASTSTAYPLTGRHALAYQCLGIAVQEDIAAVLVEHSDYVKSSGWTEIELRELFIDLFEPLKVFTSRAPVALLRQQAVIRAFSEVAVTRLQRALAVAGDLDHVIIDGSTFVDGRHRVEAYARAGRRTIPVVDIGPLLRTDWREWMNATRSAQTNKSTLTTRKAPAELMATTG